MADSKMSNPIVHIISRYDVILIQEVRDVDHKALDELLSRLTKHDPSWSYVSSKPLGRNDYKEQYAFFFRKSLVSVQATHQTLDPQDVYEREPFAINVKYQSSSRPGTRQVILSGVHIKPTHAKKELGKLKDTILEISSRWPSADGVIVMGDFNADCRYLAKIHRVALEIFQPSSSFRSLISDDADTTVKLSDCAYDRVIVYGKEVDARDAKVYNFMTDLHLNQTEAERISDHFPVGFLLY